MNEVHIPDESEG